MLFFKTGGSVNEYRIRVRKERCSAYESFVNLDVSLPVIKWPEPGVEIVWASPQEPTCRVDVYCIVYANSECLEDSGSRIAVREGACARLGLDGTHSWSVSK